MAYLHQKDNLSSSKMSDGLLLGSKKANQTQNDSFRVLFFHFFRQNGQPRLVD